MYHAKYKQTILHKHRVMYELERANTLGSKHNYRAYTRVLDKFCRMFPDRDHPDDVTRLDVEEFITKMEKDGYASKTIRWDAGVLRSFWYWMMSIEIASYNPWANRHYGAERITPDPEPIADQVLADLYAAADPFDKAMLMLAVTTGLSPTELTALTWKDIDRKEAQKNGAIISLREDVIELCNALPRGSPNVLNVKPSTLVDHLAKLQHKCGYSQLTFTRFRVTFASSLYRNGVDPRLVQKLLGKKSTRWTMRYISVEPKDYREALPRPQLLVPEVPLPHAQDLTDNR